MNRFNRNKQFGGQQITGIGEDLKIDVIDQLDQFLKDDTQKVLKFDSNLTSNERKYIHNYCANKTSLKTKSFGFGPERYLTISKKEEDIESGEQILELSPESQQNVIQLRNILKEKNQNFGQNSYNNRKNGNKFFCRSDRLSNSSPLVPRVGRINTDNYPQFRRQLPIFEFRDTILKTINSNQIVIISGDTGCGKTTQLPQYLLEDCAQNGKPCRIVVAEPRRLAAISVAERICVERSETIGRTVGYQIRLESRISNETLLTFCTNGIILRTLMSNREDFLRNVTHIIIDEVHERDRFSDFLILILKKYLNINPNIRLILMSATFNIKSFVQYFGDNCPVIEIPGRQHRVDEYFLEDILKVIEYMTLEMARYQQELHRLRLRGQTSGQRVGEVLLEEDIKEKCDLLLKDCWVDGSDQTFDNLVDFIAQDSRLIDYKNSETGVTPLVCASARNKLDVIKALITFGANPQIRTPNNMTAHDWALQFGHEEVAYHLRSVMPSQRGQSGVSEEEKELLDIYHHCFNDDDVDCLLICALLAHIFKNYGTDGAILVFLPGLDDILSVRDTILANTRQLDPRKYEIFILHSQMQSSDQKRVFLPMRNGCRKIILSTNIAETSVTIDDVVFVIDSGKVKEKSFDSLMGISSLKSVWISQSSVKQRKGRAGRTGPGLCFHLFSRNRYQSLQKHQLPEILRIPIHEVCLQSKLLVPDDKISIMDFLSEAMDPPSILSVKASVQLLKTIDALDPNEGLTQLGLRLLDLPIEPNFGKMILYSIVLKCVDPVLTIVASLSHRDPFIISLVEEKKRSLKEIRRKFGQNPLSFSDHIIYLSAFNEWSKIEDRNQRFQWCRQHLISNTNMEVIDGIRRQLMTQLSSAGFFNYYKREEYNTYSNKWSVVKAALTAGAYPKLIRYDDSSDHYCNRKEKVKFHNSSQMSAQPFHIRRRRVVRKQTPTNWCIYEELLQMGRHSYAKCLTAVSPITIALFCGPPEVRSESTQPAKDLISTSAQFIIDEWISFETNAQTVKIIGFLKESLHKLFVRTIECLPPNSQTDRYSDDLIIKCVAEVLELEEMRSGFCDSKELVLRPLLTQNINRVVPKYQSNQFFSQRNYRSEKRKFKTNLNQRF